LAPNESQSFTGTVTPNAGVPSVSTTVKTQAAQADINVLPASDDTVTKTTKIYSLAVGIVSNPSTVLAGSDTLLSGTVKNTGFDQTGIKLTIDTGSTVDPAIALPANCTVDTGNAIVTCNNISLLNGQTAQVDVAATTPPTTGQTVTSTATGAGAYGSGGTAGTETHTDATTAAFVPHGHSLSFSNANQSSTFQVPDGSAPGLVVATSEGALDPGTKCGASDCDPHPAQAIFPGTGTYSGNDPNHPFIWNITWNIKQSCAGKGFPSGCLPLYWIGSGQTIAQPVQNCPSYATNHANPAVMSDPNVPCLNFLSKSPQGGIVTYQVALLKDIQIPHIV
jgi:hypothetical protein